MITDVTKTLRFYTTHKKSTVIEKVFVCGGFSLVPGFVELLDERLPSSAELWNPFDSIRCETESQCEDVITKNGPAMAIAAGLAMRSI